MSESVAGSQGQVSRSDEDELVRLRFLAVVGLVVLNALDLILTRELLTRGGSEANPLMALVIGGGWGIALKLGVPALVGLRHLTLPARRRSVFALCWLNVLFLGVVAWNLRMLVQNYA